MKSFQSNGVFTLVDYEKGNEYSPAADPGFPRGTITYYLAKFSCMKMKKKNWIKRGSRPNFTM